MIDTCEVFLQEVLQAEKHHFVELGSFLAPALEVGIDFAEVGRILLVVRDLKERQRKGKGSKRDTLRPEVLLAPRQPATRCLPRGRHGLDA